MNYPLFMRRGVIGLVVLFSFSLFPAYAATPPKTGSVCSKQGISKTYQGKKFTCIKAGKKLVWSKGVVIKKPTPTPIPTTTPTITSTPSSTPTPNPTPTPTPTSTPTPTPTPTPTQTITPMPSPTPSQVQPPKQIDPWQTNVGTNDLIYSAMIKFKEWNSIPRGNALPAEYIFEDSLPLEITQELKIMIDATQKSLGDKGVINLKVLSGTTPNWINTKIKEKNIGQGNPAQPDGLKIEYCNSDPVSNIGCSDGRASVLLLYRTPINYFRLTERNGPIHEYFHLVGSGLSKERNFNYSREFPGWFFEGAPSYFAAAFLEVLGISEYKYPRKALLDVGTYSKHPRVPLSEYYENVFPTKYIYGIGQVGVEYMAASAGVDSVLNIYKFIGDGDSFEIAFKKSTGITLEDFYRNFDKIQDSVGIYD